MTANGPIYARVKDAAGTVVKTAEGRVSNIDKTAPLASIYEDYQTSTSKARISVDVADYETEVDYVVLPDGTKKYIEDERKDNIKIVVIEDKRTNSTVNTWQINVTEALKSFTNVTFKTDITQNELVNSDYDIVISNMGVWTSEKTAMLEAAFKAGKDIITIGNDAHNAYYVIETDTPFSATPDNLKGKKVITNEITPKMQALVPVGDGIHLINQTIEGFEDWYRYETGGQEYSAMGMYEENGARWFHSSAPEINLQSVFPYLIRKLTRVTTATYEIPKSGTYTFKVYDKAGNCTEKTITTGNYKVTYDFNEQTLQNGDFQNGITNWNKSSDYLTATPDTGIKYKNKQTMRLTTSANGTWNGITNETIASKYKANTLYKISAVAYKDDTSTYGAYKNNYNIYIPQFNGDNRQDINLGFLTLNKNKSWTKFEKEFTTTGTKWLGVYAAYNQGSGVQASNMWLANIRLERIQNANIGYGNTFGTLPTPARTGYTFAGWYTDPVGGKKINTTDKAPSQNTTYYAHWTPINYTQTIQVRFENVDGTFTGYSNAINTNYAYGSTVSWSRAADATYQAASISSYTVTGAKTTQVTVYRQKYTLDLNGMLDGTSSGNLGAYGKADVYINGTRVNAGVTDFCKEYRAGTTYEIKNIVANNGYVYEGVHSGKLSGTLTSKTGVWLKFVKRDTIKFTNVTRDGFTVEYYSATNITGARQVAIWTSKNGQDDIVWHGLDNNGSGKWSKRIYVSDHKYECGEYIAHVYDNPAAPTNGLKVAGTVNVPNTETCHIYGVDLNGYKVRIYTNRSGVTKVEVPTWTTKNDQDDIEWINATSLGNGAYNATIKVSNHNYESGEYNSHVYLTINGSRVGIGALKANVTATAPPAHTCNDTDYCNVVHSYPYAQYNYYWSSCGEWHNTCRHAICSVCGKKNTTGNLAKCPNNPTGSSRACPTPGGY